MLENKSFTTDVFFDLIRSNRQLGEIVSKVFDETYGTIGNANSALKGSAIILKAYDYMKNFDLLSRFGTLQPNDIILAQQTLEQSLPKKGENLTIAQRLLKLPIIPETQVDLNECLKKAGEFSLYRRHFKEGATAMYKMLEVLWPKLYPNPTPPQQPTTQ